MNYFQFFIANRKILLFAVILTFFSGFGQTFLLSLYIPDIIAEFQISGSQYSFIYAAATLCSGVTIIFVGKLIDRVSIKKFTLFVVLGIVVANLMAGFAFSLLWLFLAIFMLRFFGQGLLSHTAMTAMGKYFSHARGKALSIAYLGFPIAEAAFPIAIVSLIFALGWRNSFFISALIILFVLLPLSWFLLRGFDRSKVKELAKDDDTKPTYSTKEDEKVWSQKQLLKNGHFYLFAPTVFIVGFTLTALFFYQTFIAQSKGWSIEWMALNITSYAISSFVFSVWAGPLTDRFTAQRLFPIVLIPMILGLATLIVFDHPLAATAFWFLIGVSAGANPTISNALYAETYGVRSLGAIRSIFTFVMVSSTAMGPVVYSFFLDSGFGFDIIHWLVIGVIALNVAVLSLFFYYFNNKRV